MFRIAGIIAALFLIVQVAESRGIFYYEEESASDSSACSGQPNLIAPWTGEPSLVRQIDNGTLYTAGDGEDMVSRTFNTHA